MENYTFSIFTVLEFIGMICSMLGAFYLSRHEDKVPHHMLKAFGFFAISNVAMLLVSAHMLMVPLFLQVILFVSTTYLGIMTYGPNKFNQSQMKQIKLFAFALMFFVFFLLLGIYQSKTGILNFSITNIEIAAAATAIGGSFLMKYQTFNLRFLGFFLFFVADILYVKVGIDNALYFFAIQSGYFIYTSIAGMKNSLDMKEKGLLAV